MRSQDSGDPLWGLSGEARRHSSRSPTFWFWSLGGDLNGILYTSVYV